MPKKSVEPRDATQTVAIQVRMREDLRGKIEAAAAETGRSMNAEIVERLARSLDDVYASHLRPALMLIAHDAWRVEQQTGKKWTEDRLTAHAIADLAGDSFRYSTPFLNQAQINAASAELKAWKQKMEGRIAYLHDVGAISPLRQPAYRAGLGGVLANALSDLEERRPLPPDGWEEVVAAVESFNWQIEVDLTEPPSNWPLCRDGKELTAEEKVGAHAVLTSFGEFRAQSEEIMAAAEEAWKDERAAKKEAKALVARMRAAPDGP